MIVLAAALTSVRTPSRPSRRRPANCWASRPSRWARGFGALVRSARGARCERVSALEDCRQVWGSLERLLIQRGERVLRSRGAGPECAPERR